MNERRGILHLAEPLESRPVRLQEEQNCKITLIFDENERYLSQAQHALWELRKKCPWICVSARGSAAFIALSLAAQLPVDRLALADFSFAEACRSRELARLKVFARRNLSLVASEIALCGIGEEDLRKLMRGLGRYKLCLLENWEQNMLLAPWERLCENNLLIPGKCV